jgi:hypothetical protein
MGGEALPVFGADEIGEEAGGGVEVIEDAGFGAEFFRVFGEEAEPVVGGWADWREGEPSGGGGGALG